MTTGRTVNVDRLCDRPLALFVNSHSAWDHMRDHALGVRARGEEQGWRLLLPSLRSEMDGSHLEDLRRFVGSSGPDNPHPRLAPVYNEFLDRIQGSVEDAVHRAWYWVQSPDPRDNCRWVTFGHEGIQACLDADYVRTGFLPAKDLDSMTLPAVNPRYRLFLACLLRIQARYNRTQIEDVSTEFRRILEEGLDEPSWAGPV